MKRINILLTLTALIAVGLACSTLSGSSPNTPSQNGIENSETPATATATPAAPSDASSPEDTSETDGLPPLSYVEVLETGIEEGRWTLAEGLLAIMKYLIGETGPEGLPRVTEVVEPEASGIVQLTNEYLAKPDHDPEIGQQMDRYLRIMFPPFEVLEQISHPLSAISYNKLASLNLSVSQQVQDACVDLAAAGYDPNELENADEFSDNPFAEYFGDCYVYVERTLDDRTFRVYYPSWWAGDEERETRILLSLDALAESAVGYAAMPGLEVGDLYLAFAVDPFGNAKGFANNFNVETEACPIAMLPLSDQYSDEHYKQAVAHEVFHCVQRWSFSRDGAYDTNKWWVEGTAEYFSNLIYPDSNLELRNIDHLNTRSSYISIFDMAYENFAFFQFMGNQYTTATLIQILGSISEANDIGTQQGVLAAVSQMDENFNLYTVELLSSGIPDSGGQPIRFANPVVSGQKTVKEKGTVPFTVQPFVAMRYHVDYEKEKRFLQSAINPDGTQFSGVDDKLRQNRANWSDLPPEIRSECNKDVRYLFAMTTTKDSYTAYDVDVTLAEKAECDPCLLGTWDVDPESFAAYMEGIMAQSPTPQSMDLTVSGHQYLQFVEDGKVLSQRADFTITINNQVSTIINGSGSGTYTADGEKMTVSNFLDVTDSVALNYGNGQLVYQNSGDQASFSIFGEQYDTLGVDLNEGNAPTTTSAQYVCRQDTLTITLPEFGDLLFNRVEKILPTQVPTAAPPANPEP